MGVAERSIPDAHGNPITAGCVIRQLNIYNDGGALLANALREGKVVEVKKTRVIVDFERNAFHAFRVTSNPAPPVAILAKYVEVVSTPEESV